MTATCPKCRIAAIPRIIPNPGGYTTTCPNCGHTQERTPSGAPYAAPSDYDTPPLSTSHYHIQYPVGIAVTTISFELHVASTKIGDLTLTTPVKHILDCHVYHLPTRIPLTAFRANRRFPESHTRYIYAAEFTPHIPATHSMPPREYRALRQLILFHTQQLLGRPIRPAHPDWHICPPGTVDHTPLAPTP